MKIKLLEKSDRPDPRYITYGDLEVGDVFMDCDYNICIKIKTSTTEDGPTFNAVSLLDGHRLEYADAVDVGFFNGRFEMPLDDMLYHLKDGKPLSECRKYQPGDYNNED